MDDSVTRFQEYRERLYGLLKYRADATFNLLDSLSGRQSAQSVVELSLEAPFERRHSSLYDAIDNFAHGVSSSERLKKGLERIRILAPMLPTPKRRPFWVIAVDATPAPRAFSRTLADRSIVYRWWGTATR